MSNKNILFYVGITLILLIVIIIKKMSPTDYSSDYITTPKVTSLDNSNDPHPNRIEESTENKPLMEEKIPKKKYRRYKKKVLKPDIKAAMKELMNDPNFQKDSQISMYPKIIEAVATHVKSEAEAEKIMKMLQGCVSAETTVQAIEIQANCIMGAQELAKKFPTLENKMNELILQSASQKAKNLATKLSAQ